MMLLPIYSYSEVLEAENTKGKFLKHAVIKKCFPYHNVLVIV